MDELDWMQPINNLKLRNLYLKQREIKKIKNEDYELLANDIYTHQLSKIIRLINFTKYG